MRGYATRHRRNAVLAAVKEDGRALQYAHKDLKKLKKKTKKRKRKEKDEEDSEEGSAASPGRALRAPASDETLTIRVRYPSALFGGTRELFFRLKTTTMMKKVFRAYQNTQTDAPAGTKFIFRFNGEVIPGDSTAEMVGLVQDSVVQCEHEPATEEPPPAPTADATNAMASLQATTTDIEAAKFKMRMERTPATLTDGYSDTSGNIAKVWKRSRTNQATQVISEVVRRASAMQLRGLPPSQGGLYESIPYAMACGSFEQPQFVSGIVLLRPGAVKNVESTHACTQVFYVVSAQKQSFEFKIADTTFTLSTGDHFFVPAHNKYGLRNYSSEMDAVITFVVIKPHKAQAEPVASLH